MSQYVWGLGFEPDPRGIGRNGYTMSDWQQDYNNFYSQPPSPSPMGQRPTGPWGLWNAFPEERTGIGTAYINRQMQGGRSLADIKQEASNKNWVIGPDAWNKFYGSGQNQGYQQNKMGVWSTGTSSSEAFRNSMNNYHRDPLAQFQNAIQRWETRRQQHMNDYINNRPDSAVDVQINDRPIPGHEWRSSGNNPTGGPQNILKISKPKKTPLDQDVFSNQVTL